MSATFTQSVKVGDTLLYVPNYGERYQLKTVCKITKAGWVRVEGIEETFKPSRFQSRWEGGYKGQISLYLDLPANVSDINATAEAYEKAREEKKAAEAERQAKREARDAEEMAKVKAAMGGSLIAYKRMAETFPDGSRLYVLNVPVAPEHAERKKGFEVAIVHVKEEKRWGGEIETRAYHTFTNGNNDSFSSCSGFAVKDDEDALWQVAKMLHNGW